MDGLLQTFITLFVVMDPIGNLSLFTSLTKGMPLNDIKKNVNRSMIVASILLFVFLFLGLKIFSFFSINLNSFQIAGGIILLIIAVMYVLGTYQKLIKSHGSDLSVPIGTPLITGPGVITTTIILVNENGPYVTVIAAALTLLATWIILMFSSRLFKLLGEHWIDVISRVMGIILAAIAVEFITKGISGIVSQIL